MRKVDKEGFHRVGRRCLFLFGIFCVVFLSQITMATPTCQDFNLTKYEGGTDDVVNAADVGALINYINNNKGLFFSVDCNTCGC